MLLGEIVLTRVDAFYSQARLLIILLINFKANEASIEILPTELSHLIKHCHKIVLEITSIVIEIKKQ
ncbi:UNVERIFIED_CONTAM: hypothetical protein BEN50_04450 [Euhalothece sp. KZN 001]